MNSCCIPLIESSKAFEIQGLVNCFLSLFESFRIGACLVESDWSAFITLFMLTLTSSVKRLQYMA